MLSISGAVGGDFCLFVCPQSGVRMSECVSETVENVRGYNVWHAIVATSCTYLSIILSKLIVSL